MQQAKVLYSGTVQGVGFRYTAQRVARDFKVTGYVRNLDDGRVELLAEGQAAEITAFLAALASRMEGYIRDAEETRGAASCKYHGFHIAP